MAQKQGPLSEQDWLALRDTPYAHTPIIYAAKAGDVARLKHLTEHGFNMGMSWEGGTTALHIAAQHNQKEAVEFLLRQGCDRASLMVSGYSTGGRTAQQLAEEEGLEDIASLIKTWDPATMNQNDSPAEESDVESDDSEGWIRS